MKARNQLKFVMTAVIVAALAACGGSDGDGGSPAPGTGTGTGTGGGTGTGTGTDGGSGGGTGGGTGGGGTGGGDTGGGAGGGTGGGGTGGGGAAAGSAAECFNAAQFATGTTAQLDYQNTGSETGTTKTRYTVGGQTTYGGTANVTETVSDTVQTITAPTAEVNNLNVKSYQRLEGMDILSYGAVSTLEGASVQSVNSPPSRDKRFSLALNQSFELVTNATVNTGSGNVTSNSTTAVTYLGQESVTVPAGTFTACKFREDISSPAVATVTSWYAKGSGVVVKTAIGNDVDELLPSSTFNGAAVR